MSFLYNLAHISGRSASDLHEQFVTDVSLDEKVPVKFLKSSGSRSSFGYGFWNDSGRIRLGGRLRSPKSSS